MNKETMKAIMKKITAMLDARTPESEIPEKIFNAFPDEFKTHGEITRFIHWVKENWVKENKKN